MATSTTNLYEFFSNFKNVVKFAIFFNNSKAESHEYSILIGGQRKSPNGIER